MPCCALTSGASSDSSMLAHRDQVALALHHAAELGEVGLQPVLLGVALGRGAQVADHRVDVVLEVGHFAARVDLDRARQVALGHRGRHFGDRAHLRGEVRREQVHVGGQVLPGAGGARHVAPGRRGGLRRRLRAPPSSPGRRRSPSVSVMLLMVSASAAISPFASTVSFWRRSPLATAVTTFTMPRTWVVRLFAIDVDVVGEILPGAGDARHHAPGRRACLRCRPRAPRASLRRRSR